jgi:hypothetical protein
MLTGRMSTLAQAQRLRGDRGANRLRQSGDVFQRLVGHHNVELIPADAGGEALAAEDLLQRDGNAEDKFVPADVAVIGVDLQEVVQVDVNQRQRAVVLAGLGKRGLEVGEKFRSSR